MCHLSDSSLRAMNVCVLKLLSICWLFAAKSSQLLLFCSYMLISLCSSSLGGIHGIPRVHYKGRQGDYYVMVSSMPFLLSCLPEHLALSISEVALIVGEMLFAGPLSCCHGHVAMSFPACT